jgi:drug/metabolite transporter (DMT)-like permease
MQTAVELRSRNRRPEWLSWSVLWVGVLSASLSAILIRFAEGAGPLALAFWRCAAAVLVLAPFARWSSDPPGRPTIKASFVAGMFLALHFATWIPSVNLTSVAAAVLLVSTTPVFTALASWYLYRRRLPWIGWLGICLALVGVSFVGGDGFQGSALLGNVLALVGGAATAGYFLAGATARRHLGIVEYAVLTYTTAAVALLGVCLFTGESLWGYPAPTWWAIAGLVAGPQLLGHTVINSVLNQIDATSIAITGMAEPIVATALAFVLFSEMPSLLIYPGGALILVGIYLVTRARNQVAIPFE